MLELESKSVPEQYFDYCQLFLAAMAEKTSEDADPSIIGASAEFERRFPSLDDWEDEC